jgi:hypothetical protein
MPYLVQQYRFKRLLHKTTDLAYILLNPLLTAILPDMPPPLLVLANHSHVIISRSLKPPFPHTSYDGRPH